MEEEEKVSAILEKHKKLEGGWEEEGEVWGEEDHLVLSRVAQLGDNLVLGKGGNQKGPVKVWNLEKGEGKVEGGRRGLGGRRSSGAHQSGSAWR